MNNISGIAGSDYYRQIASGTRLERAADGATELAIAEKENAQNTLELIAKKRRQVERKLYQHPPLISQ